MKIQWHRVWDNLVRRFFPYEGRQRFIIGYTALSPDEIFYRLLKLGFHYDFFAYSDKDELPPINLRKFVRFNDETKTYRQIHIRAYKPTSFGLIELRMHDELPFELDAIGHLNGDTFTRASQEEINAVLSALEAIPSTEAQ